MPNHAKRCLLLQRAREKQAAWASGPRQQWAGHLAQLAGWIERVTVQVNPQVPAYFIALPHPIARLVVNTASAIWSQAAGIPPVDDIQSPTSVWARPVIS